MLSSGFIKRVLDKVNVEKVSLYDIKKILFNVQKDRELYESIFESMIEGVFVLDENNNIQYVNSNALKMFNLDFRILEKNISEVFRNKNILLFFKDILESGNEIHDRAIESGYFNDHRIIRVNAFPLKQNNKIIGTIIMLLDITARKEEQNKLRRAESLASLTTLAAGVAHEIKNPLSSIAIYIQLMERYLNKLPENFKLKFGNMISIISEEIDRLNRIISDFLFSVRPTVLNKELVNLEKLLNQLLELISLQVKEKGLNLTLKVEKKFPEIICDPNYTKNAFLNIVKNSIEACDKNDEIIISLIKEGDYVKIIFRDTGKGIPKDKINQIFDPYFTTKDFGTGLGLTIVYKIIKEHNGDISISSDLNKGTIFTIKLPIYDEGVRLIEQ